MKGIMLVLALSVLSACATAPTAPSAALPSASAESSPAPILPTQAILLAADAAPKRVPGVFAMTVKGIGEKDGYAYLNSEQDYRDQRSLTIAISPPAAAQFMSTHGETIQAYFKGRSIQVRGEAARTRIYFFADGKRTDKYYYQTQVLVRDPAQIQALGEG